MTVRLRPAVSLWWIPQRAHSVVLETCEGAATIGLELVDDASSPPTRPTPSLTASPADVPSRPSWTILLVADDAVLVQEASIIAGIRMLLDHAGLVVEPSAALGVAAILEDRDRFADRYVATIVCGSNVDVDAFHRWTGAAAVNRS